MVKIFAMNTLPPRPLHILLLKNILIDMKSKIHHALRMDFYDRVIRRLWGLLLPIGIFLHAVWGTIIWFAFLIGKDSKESSNAIDTIKYANELGRLDLISLLLAFFGIIIAIMAIGWFGYIRTEAKEEARDEIRECGAKIINEWIANNPDVITRAIQDSSLSVGQIDTITGDIREDVADQIATAISNIQGEGGQNE